VHNIQYYGKFLHLYFYIISTEKNKHAALCGFFPHFGVGSIIDLGGNLRGPIKGTDVWIQIISRCLSMAGPLGGDQDLILPFLTEIKREQDWVTNT
jgi:hypothetical protein